jgi:hypothetical protein
MLVFSYAVELDAVEPTSDNYESLVREAIKAYRARAACLTSKADTANARRDSKRADALAAKLKRPEPTNSAVAGRVEVRNEWPEPVTLTIAGISYSLPPGEAKTLPIQGDSASYEMIAGTHRVSGTVEAGKSYRVRPPPATR